MMKTYVENKMTGTTRRGGSVSSLLHDSLMGKCHFFISHLHYSFLTSHSSFGAKLLCFSFILFLLSCSGGSDDGASVPTPTDGRSVLNIYVYAPGQAVPTRGNTGQVDADPIEENTIHTLQIWMYTHEETPTLVTYFKTNAFQQDPQNTDDTYKFELPIDESYVDKDPRPTVDVYVLANVTANNCGLNFDESTSKTDLEAAVLKYDADAGTDYFGLTAPVTAVPDDGLPMSGVLRNQTVSGNKPVLTLGTSATEMAKVKLVRTVSKVRFVFSCSDDFDGLQITGVTFNNGMLPNQEYLFLAEPETGSTLGTPYAYDDNDYHINTGDGYNVVSESSPAPVLFTIDATAICEDPAHYAWDRLLNDEKSKKPDISSQELAEKYEALINEGLSSDVPATLADDQVTVIDPGHEKPRLTERRLYLRESDKRLSGTIKYKVKDKDETDYGEEKSIAFKMVGPEDPAEWQPYFSRNHTWIVYAYLSWAKIHVVAVTIKSWTEAEAEHELYNW